MAVIKINPQQEVAGVPPAFSERCAVRIKDVSFGPNRNNAPMITVGLELVGYFDANNNIQTTITRNGKVYRLAGLTVRSEYFTLTEKTMNYYAEFYRKVTGEALIEIDDAQPDTKYLEAGPTVQAIVSGKMNEYRKQLTDEEKAIKIANNEEPVGDPILDDEGKPLQTAQLKVVTWIKKYEGPLPPEVGTF